MNSLNLWALVTPEPTSLKFLDVVLSLAIFLLQFTLLFLVLRMSRVRASGAFRHLMWACVCYLLAEAVLFATAFLPGLLWSSRSSVNPPAWAPPVRQVLVILFLVFITRAIRCFLRGESAVASATLESAKPSQSTSERSEKQ